MEKCEGTRTYVRERKSRHTCACQRVRDDETKQPRARSCEIARGCMQDLESLCDHVICAGLRRCARNCLPANTHAHTKLLPHARSGARTLSHTPTQVRTLPNPQTHAPAP
eukprot:6210198-Pleurochrysis_carterae.AAC.2